jgi:hypothetical protein
MFAVKYNSPLKHGKHDYVKKNKTHTNILQDKKCTCFSPINFLPHIVSFTKILIIKLSIEISHLDASHHSILSISVLIKQHYKEKTAGTS